eukprot:6192107-Pleurochrysis_carterae.AAC.2
MGSRVAVCSACWWLKPSASSHAASRVHLSLRVRRRHGADDISAGERNNLIVWNSNSKYRAAEPVLTRLRQQERTLTGRRSQHVGAANRRVGLVAAFILFALFDVTNYLRRSSTGYINTQPYLKEEGPPDPRCLSYTHDRDFAQFLDYPPGKEAYRGRGWCPPPFACYDSMSPVLRGDKQEL